MRSPIAAAFWAWSCAACSSSPAGTPTGSASAAEDWYCFDLTVHVPGACVAMSAPPPPPRPSSAPSGTASSSPSGAELAAPAPAESASPRDCDTDEPASRCLPTLDACEATRKQRHPHEVTVGGDCRRASAAYCAEASGERVCAETRRHWELATRGY